MKRAASILGALSLLLLPSCGDDAGSRSRPPPPASGAPAPGGSAVSPEASRAPPPPDIPARPRLSPERLAELSKTEIAGFQRTSERASKSNAMMTYEGTTPNAQGYRPTATVIIEPCAFCARMDLAEWRANPNLKRMLSSAHLENPALVFQVDELDLGGRKAIAVYKESFVETKTASGTSRSTAHGLDVWFNDGVHQVLIQVSPRGKTRAGSAEELRASLSRAEMEAAARALFAPFAEVF